MVKTIAIAMLTFTEMQKAAHARLALLAGPLLLKVTILPLLLLIVPAQPTRMEPTPALDARLARTEAPLPAEL